LAVDGLHERVPTVQSVNAVVRAFREPLVADLRQHLPIRDSQSSPRLPDREIR
jgi:hypothetical protein